VDFLLFVLVAASPNDVRLSLADRLHGDPQEQVQIERNNSCAGDSSGYMRPSSPDGP
jgi:hypothetical protein